MKIDPKSQLTLKLISGATTIIALVGAIALSFAGKTVPEALWLIATGSGMSALGLHINPDENPATDTNTAG